MAGNRIALIDDHAAVRQALSDLLEVYGYDVVPYPIFSAFSAIYRNDYGKPLIYSRPPQETSM